MNADTHHTLWQAAALIVPLILAIVCHEVAHGLVARRLGDPTAQQRGRLTLNPLAHVDPFGTVILPGLLALAHAPVFGWAKPVPVDPRWFRNPRRGMMLVGAAGPATNFVLAGVAAVGLGLLARAVPAPAWQSLAAFTADNLGNFLALNLFIGLFNLLPVPPFDGSHIVEGLLPLPLARVYARTRRWGMLLAIALVVLLPALTGTSVVARFVLPPFVWMYGHYLALASWVAGANVGG